MPLICPTITAYDLDDYNRQLSSVMALSKRIHIDIMDNIFTSVNSVNLSDLNFPKAEYKIDLHLMLSSPMEYITKLIELKPNLVIVHSEANVPWLEFCNKLHDHGILAGLSLLSETSVSSVRDIINNFDHVLIFSGFLGHFGGQADLKLLDKVTELKQYFPKIEVGWDGGINDVNINVLAQAGVDVLDVGSFISQAVNPVSAYGKLKTIIQ